MTHLRHLVACLLVSFISLPLLTAQTQADLAQLEPADLFFSGWILSRDADQLIEKEDYLDAYSKLQRAKAIYDTMAIHHATYEPNLVEMRQDLTRETMEKIYPKAETQQKKSQNASPFIEGEGPGKKILVPVDRAADSARAKKMSGVQGEIDQLKRQLSASTNRNDATAAKLRKTLKELEELKNEINNAPLKSEMDALNDEILGLRRERGAIALALSKTKAALSRTEQERDLTQKALTETQREIRELNAVIAEQTKVNGRVVRNQQEQIDEKNREIKRIEGLFAKEREKTRSLERQVEQSMALIEDLQIERDDLIREKNQMAAFLKMNSSEGVQELVTQNVALSKELNDARRQMEAAMESANASKDDIVLAQRGLTVAKAKIREAQKENTQQTLRITTLEKRLQQAEEDLLKSESNKQVTGLAKEEITALRETAKKQRNALEAEKKKSELLVAQAKRMGLKDPHWKQAVAQFEKSYVPEISQAEEAIIDQVRSDFTANSRFDVSPQERLRAARELRGKKDDLNKVATKLYKKNDLEAARGILEMVIEEDPAAWDAMINLGIVQLRLGEDSEAARQFEQAILYAGDRKIPLAHFMLGDAYYRAKLFSDAEREINLSLSLEPDNAQAHVLLGNMAGKMGKTIEAKFHFKQAIKIDPNIWEPHFNLAYMAARNGKTSNARILYQEALRRGAPARPDLEQQLGL